MTSKTVRSAKSTVLTFTACLYGLWALNLIVQSLLSWGTLTAPLLGPIGLVVVGIQMSFGNSDGPPLLFFGLLALLGLPISISLLNRADTWVRRTAVCFFVFLWGATGVLFLFGASVGLALIDDVTGVRQRAWAQEITIIVAVSFVATIVLGTLFFRRISRSPKAL